MSASHRVIAKGSEETGLRHVSLTCNDEVIAEKDFVMDSECHPADMHSWVQQTMDPHIEECDKDD